MTNTDTIEIISGVNQLKDRFNELNNKYIIQAFKTENPVVQFLCEEFVLYEKARNLQYKTVLCEHKHLINDYYTIIWEDNIIKALKAC